MVMAKSSLSLTSVPAHKNAGVHKKVSILMYHQVGEFQRVQKLKANYCHIQDFTKQMAFLALCRYPVIPMSKVVDFLRGDYLPNSPKRWFSNSHHAVAITFDDGYQGLYTHAAPVLAHYGFSAMVYLVSGQIGGQAQWLQQVRLPAAQLLNAAEIRAMAAQGIEFGAHSVNHPRLSTLPESQARQEMRDSKQQLESQFAMPFEHFCYPYGDHNSRTLELAREIGFKSATTIVKGTATDCHDPLALPRKAISFGRGRYRLWRDIVFKQGQLTHSVIQRPICQH